MKFQEYLKRRVELREKAINEDGSAVDFGPVIDIAAIAAGKAIWNGAIFAKNSSQLPAYIKEYKIWGAPKAGEIYKEKASQEVEKMKDQLNKMLGKGGDRSSKNADRTSAKDGEKEMSLKARISAQIDAQKAQIDKKEGLPEEKVKAMKDALTRKEEAAHQKIDLQIQSLDNKIQGAETKIDNTWDQGKLAWDDKQKKWDKKFDSFAEIKGTILGSSWSSRWDKKLMLAKREADFEVLDEYQKMMLEKGNQKEVEAITKAKERIKEQEEQAKEVLDEIEKKSKEDEKNQVSAEELGIPDVITSSGLLKDMIDDVHSTWKQKAKELEGSSDKEGAESGETSTSTGDQEAGKKKDLEEKISQAEKKIAKAESIVKKLKEAGKEERAAKVEDAIKKAQQQVEDYRNEISQLGESTISLDLDLFNEYVKETLSFLSQTIAKQMILQEDEESGEENPTISGAIGYMKKAVNSAPEEEKKSLSSEAIKNLQELRMAVIKNYTDRLKMAQNFEKNPEASGEGISEFKSMVIEDGKIKESVKKSLDDAKTAFEDDMKFFEEKGGERQEIQEPEEVSAEKPETTSDTSDEPEEKEEEIDTEAVKKQKEKIASVEKEIKDLEDAKTELSNKSNKTNKDKDQIGILDKAIPNKKKDLEKEKAKLEEIKKGEKSSSAEKSPESEPPAEKPETKEETTEDSEVKALEDEVKKLDDEWNQINSEINDIEKQADESDEGKKIAELNQKREELRNQMRKIADEKGKDSDEYKSVSDEHTKVYDEADKLRKDYVEGKGKELAQKIEDLKVKRDELGQKWRDAKKKLDQAKEPKESTSVKLPKKYMKFEEFLAMKKQK